MRRQRSRRVVSAARCGTPATPVRTRRRETPGYRRWNRAGTRDSVAPALARKPIDESALPDERREPTIDLSLEKGNFLRYGERAVDGLGLGVRVEELPDSIDATLVDVHVLAAATGGHTSPRGMS